MARRKNMTEEERAEHESILRSQRNQRYYAKQKAQKGINPEVDARLRKRAEANRQYRRLQNEQKRKSKASTAKPQSQCGTSADIAHTAGPSADTAHTAGTPVTPLVPAVPHAGPSGLRALSPGAPLVDHSVHATIPVQTLRSPVQSQFGSSSSPFVSLQPVHAPLDPLVCGPPLRELRSPPSSYREHRPVSPPNDPSSSFPPGSFLFSDTRIHVPAGQQVSPPPNGHSLVAFPHLDHVSPLEPSPALSTPGDVPFDLFEPTPPGITRTPILYSPEQMDQAVQPSSFSPPEIPSLLPSRGSAVDSSLHGFSLPSLTRIFPSSSDQAMQTEPVSSQTSSATVQTLAAEFERHVSIQTSPAISRSSLQDASTSPIVFGSVCGLAPDSPSWSSQIRSLRLPPLRDYPPVPGSESSHALSFVRARDDAPRAVSPVLPSAGPSRPCSPLSDLTPEPPSPRAVPAPLPFTDISEGLLGVQVPATAGTVDWAAGYRTVLPAILDENGNNYATSDVVFVQFLAQHPQCVPGSRIADFPDPVARPREIVASIRRAMSQGKPAVLRAYYNVADDFEMTLEGLETAFGVSPRMRVDIHDVGYRALDFSNPYVSGTIADVIEGIAVPTRIQYVLACFQGQRGLPPGLDLINDGIVQGWNQTTVDYNIVDTTIHPDNWSVGGWSLVHQAAVVTYPHHDADGENTWVSVLHGIKFWCPIIPKPAYRGLKPSRFRDLVERICTYEAPGLLFPSSPGNASGDKPSSFTRAELSLTLSELCDIEVVVLRPGDMLFQPGGMLHAVYTPLACVAIGGHFYSYDTMHFTEEARDIDSYHSEITTNQEHYHALDTLIRMVLALPRLSPNVVLRRRSLIALLVMVLKPLDYEQDAKVRRRLSVHASHKMSARNIANRVLHHLGLTLPSALVELSVGDRYDPGPVVDLADSLAAYEVIPPAPRSASQYVYSPQPEPTCSSGRTKRPREDASNDESTRPKKKLKTHGAFENDPRAASERPRRSTRVASRQPRSPSTSSSRAGSVRGGSSGLKLRIPARPSS